MKPRYFQVIQFFSTTTNNMITGCKYANAIEEATRIIKPYHKEHYPYAPYEFRDMDEVNAYVDRARKANMDSLHSQAKQIALEMT